MAPINRTRKQRLHYVLALLLLAIFPAIQTVSAIAEQVHSHGSSHSHCCAACHAGHLSVVQARRIFNIAPATVAEWRKPLDAAPVAGESLSTLNFSRAPPA